MGGWTFTLMVKAKDKSPFPVRLASNIPRLAGVTFHLQFLRFHISAYDAAVMLRWPCLPELRVADLLEEEFPNASDALEAAVQFDSPQRSHVLLGQSVLGQMGGLVQCQGRDLMLIPSPQALPLDPLLQREFEAAARERAAFLQSVQAKNERFADWVGGDHDANHHPNADDLPHDVFQDD